MSTFAYRIDTSIDGVTYQASAYTGTVNAGGAARAGYRALARHGLADSRTPVRVMVWDGPEQGEDADTAARITSRALDTGVGLAWLHEAHLADRRARSRLAGLYRELAQAKEQQARSEARVGARAAEVIARHNATRDQVCEITGYRPYQVRDLLRRHDAARAPRP